MIAPEFWTDATMVALPMEARLLFIGLWNFADDHGYLADEPEQLALQVLPADPVDVEALVDLLVAAERLTRYVAEDGERYLHIRHFAEHQRVDHPSQSKYAHRERSRKVAIPQAVRRAVATKYGCPPNGVVDADCYYCGASGSICWWPGRNGKTGSWVSFSRLELDHFPPESEGGAASAENIVLACRACNRSKGPHSGLAFLSAPRAKAREDSRTSAKPPAQLVSLEEVSLEEENSVQTNEGGRARDPEGAAPPPAPPKGRRSRSCPKPSRCSEVVAAIRAAGVPVELTTADTDAISGSAAPPSEIAAAYVAMFRGEWGDQFDRDHLNVHHVIKHLAGYRAMQVAPDQPETAAYAPPAVEPASVEPASAEDCVLWTAALVHLADGMTRTNFETWLADTTLLGRDGPRLVIGTPSAAARDWLDTRLRLIVRRALQDLAPAVEDVAFVLTRPNAADRAPPATAAPIAIAQ